MASAMPPIPMQEQFEDRFNVDDPESDEEFMEDSNVEAVRPEPSHLRGRDVLRYWDEKRRYRDLSRINRRPEDRRVLQPVVDWRPSLKPRK